MFEFDDVNNGITYENLEITFNNIENVTFNIDTDWRLGLML